MSGRGARVSNAANANGATHLIVTTVIKIRQYRTKWGIATDGAAAKCITEQDGDLIYNIFDSGAVKWEFM